MIGLIDKENMLFVLDDFPQQIVKGFELGEKVNVNGAFKNIVFSGMGGSGLPGDIARTLLRDRCDIPVISQKDYGLPKFVSKDTLFFAVSYSGNTEETLDAYRVARGKGCTIVAICSGGKLREIAEKDNVAHIVVPTAVAARTSIGYMFFAALRVLVNSGIVKEDVNGIAEKLQNPDFKMKGEELASSIMNKIPIIYASEAMGVAALVWKVCFNESAKIPSFVNVFPELNHNELMAYTKPQEKFHVIFIREDDCSRQLAKRFKMTRDLISSKVSTTEMVVKGNGQLLKLFSAIYIGYWTSYFLALKYRVDPADTKLQAEFKKKL
ncbi:MAG: bifunctional phosphoglucose/phosphomannose isomerase [Candidatus Woesearchaeota archaeon]